MFKEQFRSVVRKIKPHKSHVEGRTPEEKKHIGKKLLYSAIMAGAGFAIYRTAETSALTGLVSDYRIEETVQKSPYLMLAGTVAVNHITALVSGIQNLRLLKNKRIGASPNFAATFAFYSLEKIAPKHKKTRDILSVVTPNFISKDPFLIASALASERVLLGYVTANMLTTGLNVVQIIGKEGFIRVFKEKKEVKNKTKELTIVSSGKEKRIQEAAVVFQSAENDPSK